jgi:hypothetical protein
MVGIEGAKGLSEEAKFGDGKSDNVTNTQLRLVVTS